MQCTHSSLTTYAVKLHYKLEYRQELYYIKVYYTISY